MKKYIFTVLFIAASIWGWRTLATSEYRKQPANEVQAMAAAPTFANTPTPRPTDTPVPPPTIDYQTTAVIAQQTADEARRLNAVATSQYEQRILDQVRITAEHEQRVHEIYSWTQEAAGTVIPLTATQQAIVNTQIPAEQMIIAARMTATEHAPTQMAVMVRAENDAKFYVIDHWVRIFFMIAIGVFVVGIVFYMFKYPPPTRRDENNDDAEPTETIIQLKKDNGQGMGSMTRYVVPCTKQQLSELAELAFYGERTFAINRLENNSRTLNRDVLYAFREFLLGYELAFPPKPGEIALNERGVAFLEGWFNTHNLPEGFEFDDRAKDQGDERGVLIHDPNYTT